MKSSRAILKIILFIIVLIAGVFCRKKTNNSTTLPIIEELPAVTQEGKNTCGFLVNGKVWLPKGKIGNGEPNLKWWYDPAYRNGTFNINGSRAEKENDSFFTSFAIGISNCTNIGTYILNKTEAGVAIYSDYYKSCIYYYSDTVIGNSSFLTITKFDTINKIIAGLFEFTLAKPGCDTIRITKGRFDIKF